MNFKDMMQKAQGQMEQMQRELAMLEATGTAGGGLVKIKINGKRDVLGCQIDPSLLAQDQLAVLQDLIVAAGNDANQKVEKASQEVISTMTGGLNLPGGR